MERNVIEPECERTRDCKYHFCCELTDTCVEDYTECTQPFEKGGESGATGDLFADSK